MHYASLLRELWCPISGIYGVVMELVYLYYPVSARPQEGQDYLAAMAAAANYAWVNRSSMTFLVRQAFAKQFGREPDDLDMHVVYDVSHNIAKVCVGLVVVFGFSALQCCGFTVSHLERCQDMRCCAINLVPWSRRLRLSQCTAHFGLVVWSVVSCRWGFVAYLGR
jgi:hypothetical protein